MDVFKNFWSFLDYKRKIFFFIIVFFSILQTIFEMVGIAAAIPFVTYLLKPEALKDVSFISNYFDTSKISLSFLLVKFLTSLFFHLEQICFQIYYKKFYTKNFFFLYKREYQRFLTQHLMR